MSRSTRSSIIFNPASPVQRNVEPSYIMGSNYPPQFMDSPLRSPNPLLALLPENLRSSTTVNRGGSFLLSSPGSRPYDEQELLSPIPRRFPVMVMADRSFMMMDPQCNMPSPSPSPPPFTMPMPMLQLHPTLPEDSRIKRLEELMAGRGQTKGHVGAMRKTHQQADKRIYRIVSKRQYTRKTLKNPSPQTEAPSSISQDEDQTANIPSAAPQNSDLKFQIYTGEEETWPEKTQKRLPKKYNKTYKCRACRSIFNTPQALGGHRSRKTCEKPKDEKKTSTDELLEEDKEGDMI